MAESNSNAFADLLPDPIEADRTPLIVEHLTVRFGGLTAVSDVTFSLNAHEMVCVVGQNGAGKSTLLNSLSGLVVAAPNSHIFLHGTELADHSAWQRARRGVGRAFQDPLFVDDVSCLENLLLGGSVFMPSPAQAFFRPIAMRRRLQEVRERARLVLDVIGLSHLADTPAGQLPYGTRKLLDIGRSLMSAPRLLLLDEPTSGLDRDEQDVVRELLLSIRAAQRTIVLAVEHHMELVRAVSDRVLVLDAGTLELLAPPEEALGIRSVKEERS